MQWSRVLIHLVGMLGLCGPLTAAEPRAWFADGYHGGVYGHYPATFTQFMVDGLKQHPGWKLNLEIEPETWDFARTNTPEAYAAFKALVTDPALRGRIEFVNPAYGQSYLWNISGESVIQQFDRGMRKVHEHFPNVAFTTYCSEEPCFTSALPGILKSFGFKYAVLKNPNTCWGGYTRAHGGELVDWVGPDGTAIPAVPRYAVEALKSGSTWETLAAANSPAYIQAALQAGIAHPVGMCLQDAGWRFGPWLGRQAGAYQPSQYVTWQEYFQTVAGDQPQPEWRLSQEDIQVSLVWGAQVLQRIAQQVRRTENRLVMAEKLATLAGAFQQHPWPESALDEAWRTLLLAQHHDCWIVPYNGRRGNTWADKVQRWTEASCHTADEIITATAQEVGRAGPARRVGSQEPDSATPGYAVRVFNTLASARTNLAQVNLPTGWTSAAMTLCDPAGHPVPTQIVNEKGTQAILFPARVTALGYSTYQFEAKPTPAPQMAASALQQPDGEVRLETDFYSAELDPKKGGTFRSLIAKQLGHRELVDATNARSFNELRGYFFEQHRFCSSTETPARLEILENGPVRLRVRVTNQVGSNAVTQLITLVQGEPRIDLSVRIDWQNSPGIGADPQQFGGFRREQDRKAFYDDRCKLLALFPLNLHEQQVFKDAPFDVTESRLTDTFFDSWSGIKNNVLLHWVDVVDPAAGVGVALLSDHTTSYVHGTNYPLGLTLQYSGVGLWGRDYSLHGPTELSYALLPHAGNWRQANVWDLSDAWNEPLVAQVVSPERGLQDSEKSLLTVSGGGWAVPTMRWRGGKVLVRLFNPSADAGARTLHYSGSASKVEVVQVNGQVVRELALRKEAGGGTLFQLALPSMGLGTLRITP